MPALPITPVIPFILTVMALHSSERQHSVIYLLDQANTNAAATFQCSEIRELPLVCVCVCVCEHPFPCALQNHSLLSYKVAQYLIK